MPSYIVDYCNAILVGVSDGVIRKLQSVLHAAARLVTGVRWNEHITPTLRDTLHWLPCTAPDHIQDCNDGVQMCSWRVSGILY